MKREIRFNAFTMNTVGHISPGMWTHPRDQSHRYTELAHWAELARTLERGKFDGIFLADVVGIYDDYAEEYVEVCYKLWEGSWEDDAVLRDKLSRVFADPAKVHPIRHDGPHFRLEGIHLSEPSPQRTPVLYQAGASGRGRAFAARH